MTTRIHIVRCVVLLLCAVGFSIAAHIGYLAGHFALGMLCTTASIFNINMLGVAYMIFQFDLRRKMDSKERVILEESSETDHE